MFGVPHGCILSAFRQQFIVSTGFSNLSIRYHKDLICIFDDGKGMGNHYHSLFLFQQIGDSLLYCQLVLDVKGRRGFIRKMEKGYDTPTGENGNLLSGGERQRISIARAILKNSPILLLDEATASLDIENELAVKQAIANLLKAKKTVVMIAHTLSIVKNADQILVVSDGKIAEAGTHDELLAKGGKYAAMWNAEQKLSA